MSTGEPDGISTSLQFGEQLERSFSVDRDSVTDHLDGMPGLLSTPALVSFMEQAAYDVTRAHLAPGYATVGARVEVRHELPSYVGDVVVVSAVFTSRSRRRLRYRVEARVGSKIVGRGEVEQSIIALDRFAEGRLGPRLEKR